jgi:hypothetical protein
MSESYSGGDKKKHEQPRGYQNRAKMVPEQGYKEKIHREKLEKMLAAMTYNETRISPWRISTICNMNLNHIFYWI